MDFQTAFNVLIGLVLPIAGWYCRQMWDAMCSLRNDLAKLREEIPKEYVSKSDWKDGIKEIKELLLQINEKLDRKADK